MRQGFKEETFAMNLTSSDFQSHCGCAKVTGEDLGDKFLRENVGEL